MRAVWFRIAVELRARWSAHVALVLLIGLGGALSLGALAGARRTETAYPRFLRAQNASDFGTAFGPYNEALGIGNVDPDAVRALPEVREVQTIRYLFAGLLDRDGDVIITPGSHAAFSPPSSLERVTAVDGRLPRDDALDEIALGLGAAREAGVEVGDEVLFLVLSPESVSEPTSFGQGEPVAVQPATVVGIAAFPGAFPPKPRFGQYIISDAAVAAWGEEAAWTDAVLIDAHDGVIDAAFKTQLDRIGGGRQLFISQVVEAADVQRSIDLEAGALRIFGVITAIAAFLIVGQALARLLFQEADEDVTLQAIGMTPAQRRAIIVGRVALLATGGAAVAAAGAWGLSAALPLGLAAIAEPNPGPMADVLVLGVGGSAVVLAVSVSTLPSAIRVALRRDRASARQRPSRVAQAFSRAGFGPAVSAGVRMAVEQGRGRTATPVRTVVVGVAVAIAALVAAISVGASATRLLETPRLFGWDHDIALGNPYAPGIARAIAPVLEERDDIAAYSGGITLATVQIAAGDERISVGVQAYDLVRGNVHPPVVDGRWPEDLDEIALGARVMRALGVGAGDVVMVDGGGDPVPMEVVGRAVFPSFGDPNVAELGDAAGLTFEAYQRLAPSAKPSVFLVRFSVDADRDAAVASLGEQLGGAGAPIDPERPADLDGIARVDGLPVVLAGTLALLAAATLIHALVTTIRRRRRDFAILSTLGFDGRQVRCVVVWQSITLTAMAVAVGVPLGLAGGRWLWRSVADRVGFLADPVLAVAPAAAVALSALLLAAAVALLPASGMMRLRPAVVLRSE